MKLRNYATDVSVPKNIKKPWEMEPDDRANSHKAYRRAGWSSLALTVGAFVAPITAGLAVTFGALAIGFIMAIKVAPLIITTNTFVQIAIATIPAVPVILGGTALMIYAEKMSKKASKIDFRRDKILQKAQGASNKWKQKNAAEFNALSSGVSVDSTNTVQPVASGPAAPKMASRDSL
jgi:hypothetical protein